jgi:hypothetical protein
LQQENRALEQQLINMKFSTSKKEQKVLEEMDKVLNTEHYGEIYKLEK